MAENKQQGKDFYAKTLALLESGSYAEAERLCLLILETDSSVDYRGWFYLGIARQFQGKLLKALESFTQASVLAPTDVNVMNAKSSCYEQLERYQDAYNTLYEAYEIAPDNADVCANLAVAMTKLGQQDKALQYYDEALNLDPKNRVALVNRGTLLARLGKRMEGLAHYRQAYQLCPEVFDILYNLVDALIGMFEYEEALSYCEIGLTEQPNHAYLMFKKGMVLSCLRRFTEGQESLSRAQVMRPNIIRDLLPQMRNLATASIYVSAKTLYLEAMYEEQLRCYWKNRPYYLEELKKSILEPEAVYETLRHREFGFEIFSLDLDAQTRLKLMGAISEYVQDGAWLKGIPPFIHNRKSGARIKIGYISPDFRQHPVGLLTKNIYGLHSRQEFEVIGYSLFESPEDVIYKRIKESCDQFHNISELSSEDAARKIYADGIDILIDLAGYTTFSNTEIFAFKPAPLQISYLGYPGTMGSDFMDYAVVDNMVCIVKDDADWHESLLKLPNSYLVYDASIPNTAVSLLRSDYHLPDNGIVFCCLNTAYKIEPAIFSVWMRILEQVENSVLWLAATDQCTVENLRAEAVTRGVTADRLIFAEKLSPDKHWPRYQLADLFLDTFWHNAHTTAADALWQGLPVLTCVGKATSSRLAASLLNALEMPELISKDLNEYEEKAIFYATHPEALQALKQNVKAARYTAPLFDTPRSVRALERGYKMAWQRYQDGLVPTTIDVPDEVDLESAG